MPACCCPVHAGQAGLVIGDMHGLYVHTHTHTHTHRHTHTYGTGAYCQPDSVTLLNDCFGGVCGPQIKALCCGGICGNTASTTTSIHASLLRVLWEAQIRGVKREQELAKLAAGSPQWGASGLLHLKMAVALLSELGLMVASCQSCWSKASCNRTLA